MLQHCVYMHKCLLIHISFLSVGKKGKKSKGKTVPLTDFLQESSGIASVPVKKFNWSDEVEDALGKCFVYSTYSI